MEVFGRMKEPFLSRFMELKHGIASHDAFSDLFNALDPEGLLNVMLRMARDWAGTLGDIVAVDGKALRRSFEDAANRSPPGTEIRYCIMSDKLSAQRFEYDERSTLTDAPAPEFSYAATSRHREPETGEPCASAMANDRHHRR